jgi:hypothetical protein
MEPVRGTISGSAAALYALGAVRPVRPIVPNAERTIAPGTDTWEPSAAGDAAPRVTYDRSGRCG